ncbi:MAG: SAP domain-containing protein [Candidatus Thalassarchaeaceae archaeon]|nr:SAP domain-containing protein [Candidatus Thalassarchaeaceae archaeon]
MPPDDTNDRDSLSSMTVAELREICRDRGLLVSGKKAEIIDRILGEPEEEESEPEVPEALILEDDVPEEEEKSTSQRVEEALSRTKDQVIEAEVVVAEVVAPEPVEEPTEDDQASLVITIPSISSLGDEWKKFAAVAVVVLLVGVLATQFLQRASGFETRELHYGDSMDFMISDSTIAIQGEEMLGLVRDSTGEILDDACEELSVEMSGTGAVSVADGFDEGAVGTTDSLGRSGFTAVEKSISMDLNVDFEGRTWRDPGDCGSIKWVLEGNEMVLGSTSWVEIEDVKTIRTDSSLFFRDADSETTNLRVVSYGASSLGGIGDILPTLSFPLTPIELHEFFGNAVIKEGARSTDPELGWDSDWSWEVKQELSDPSHGLVYEVRMEHEDIGDCYGHAHLTLWVKEGSPWPVRQAADIVLDKDLQTSRCDFLSSAISEEVLPEGRLTIGMTMSKTGSGTYGSDSVDWGRNYLKPTAGEDRPGTTSERSWVDSMVDESQIRDFPLEEATTCLKSTYPSHQASQALDSGGYVWKSEWSHQGEDPEWNLSWVDDMDRSGWLVLRQVASPPSDGCEITSDGTNSVGDVSWNRDSIPRTQTMDLLETRVLEDERYPGLSQYIESGGDWHEQAHVGYRLSVTQDNEILSLLPGDLGDGKATLTAGRDWENGGRDRSVDMAMDAETGEMVLWYYVDRST